jgi:hypothetical protein
MQNKRTSTISKTLLLSFCVFFTVFSSPILAQTTKVVTPTATPVPTVTTQTVTNYYDIEVSVGTQSAWTNKVPITVRFKPAIDSLKTDVSWDAPIGVKITNKYDNYFATTAGQVYTVTADLTPQKSGTYDIAVNVTAWNTDANYTNTERFTITFDNSLVITPLQPGYAFSIALRIFLYVVAAGIIIFLLIIGLKKGLLELKQWLKPPEF